MATSQLIQKEVLLIYIFALFQEVLPFVDDCGYYSCFDSFCCFNTCCFKTETPEDTKPHWFVPAFAVFGTLVCISCVFMICIRCCKMCLRSEQPRLQEPAGNGPIPSLATAPTLPPVPSVMQATAPPPYHEVVWKPYIYPAPTEQPPSYDNIAMEDLSSLDISQPPGSMPMNHS